MTERRVRALTLSPALLRAYSRRGNFHADDGAARQAGLPEPVAQGMQVAGAAYALLLEAWGDGWLDHGELEVTFVAMVRADETVEAVVELAGDEATLEVRGGSGDARVVGRARRGAPGQ